MAESTAPQVRTLMQAHDLLVAERPSSDASVQAWRAYYRRSARVYAEVAEIDRGHHHEALYWVNRERRKADELESDPDEATST